MQRSAPKPATIDRQQIPARMADVRANYEDTSLELAWATAIVGFIMLVLLAIL